MNPGGRVEYRIVRDGYLGFEVQFRRRRAFLPSFWHQCGRHGGIGTNSHATLEAARAFAHAHVNGGIVEYLGFLGSD